MPNQKQSNFMKVISDLAVKVESILQGLFILVFRLNWGWQFFEIGKGKLTNHAQVVKFFTSLGIPYPDVNAWFVGGLEGIGGLLLIVGLASRPVGFLLTVTMLMAYITVPEDRAKLLNIFKDQTPFLNADPFFFLLTALLVFCFGAGVFSLDALIAKLCRDKRKKAVRL